MKKFLTTAGYILLMILAYMAFQVAFTFIAMIAAMVYATYKGYIAIETLEQIADYDILTSSPRTDNIYIWAMAIGLFLATVAMLCLIYYTRGYRITRNIFRSISPNSLFLSTMLVLSAMFALNIFVQWFQLKDNLSQEFDGLTRNIIGIITISLLAPLLEEVLFRGAIQGYLLRRYKPWIAIVCAGLMFGIIHWNPIQTAYATLLGIIFGWIYYRTGSLLSVIVGHILNNSIASAVMLLFGNEELKPLPQGAVPPMTETASEIFTFLFFASLAVYFAIKLHRSLPPVPSPWQDNGGTIR